MEKLELSFIDKPCPSLVCLCPYLCIHLSVCNHRCCVACWGCPPNLFLILHQVLSHLPLSLSHPPTLAVPGAALGDFLFRVFSTWFLNWKFFLALFIVSETLWSDVWNNSIITTVLKQGKCIHNFLLASLTSKDFTERPPWPSASHGPLYINVFVLW